MLDLAFSSASHLQRGAPASLQARLDCSTAPATTAAGTGTIEYILRWFNKTATHVPETIWMSNVPIQLDDLGADLPLPRSAAAETADDAPFGTHAERRGRVLMDKLGSMVDPMEVDLSDQPGCHGSDSKDKLVCGIHLHGVGDGGVTIVYVLGYQFAGMCGAAHMCCRQ